MNILKSKNINNRAVKVGACVAGCLIVMGAGAYAIHAAKSPRKASDSATSAVSSAPTNAETPKGKVNSDVQPDVKAAPVPEDRQASVPSDSDAQKPRSFTFTDTSDWETHASRDGSFSVKYKKYLVYTTCPDLGDNLMTAMAGPTNSDLECGSLLQAVSVQPYKNRIDTVVLRTETAIAQTDDIWPKSGVNPLYVTLAGGQSAIRYEFDSTILGKEYHTIEYDAMVAGKRYVAIDNWQFTKNPNTSVEDFDTMIQKTWLFN